MGGEEVEIRSSVEGHPIFGSPPVVHESGEKYGLVIEEVSLNEFIVIIQFFCIHLLYVPSDFKTHLQILY